MSINRVCIAKAMAYFKDWRIVLLNDEDVLNTGLRLGPKTLAIYLHVGDFGIIGTVAWAANFWLSVFAWSWRTSALILSSPHARTWTGMSVCSCDLNQHRGFQLATDLQHWMLSLVS